jgi:hypothetical protein
MFPWKNSSLWLIENANVLSELFEVLQEMKRKKIEFKDKCNKTSRLEEWWGLVEDYRKLSALFHVEGILLVFSF